MGRGTALAVAGVSICLLGLLLAQMGLAAAFAGFLIGVIGVAVSFAGVVDEHEAGRQAQPPGHGGR